MTVTIDIPADRRITVPREVPVGRTVLTFTPDHAAASPKAPVEGATSSKPRITREMLREMTENCPDLKALTGILHTDMTVEQIRDERLAKHSR